MASAKRYYLCAQHYFADALPSCADCCSAQYQELLLAPFTRCFSTNRASCSVNGALNVASKDTLNVSKSDARNVASNDARTALSTVQVLRRCDTDRVVNSRMASTETCEYDAVHLLTNNMFVIPLQSIMNGPEAQKPIVLDTAEEEFPPPSRYWTGITICAHSTEKLSESPERAISCNALLANCTNNAVRKPDSKYDFIYHYVNDVLILHRIMVSQSVAKRSKPEPNLMRLIQGILVLQMTLAGYVAVAAVLTLMIQHALLPTQLLHQLYEPFDTGNHNIMILHLSPCGGVII
ncbi:hypothetical protein KP509_33G037500 [Ceratopteris richardii]|uniref:Uncharacterized protein n=1 Tax=Ceratopteris richardii TaxID=49495 RepID=A0A8T2QQK0_CERRI|nr:hypothetical protein KP509_33G037500 [Ceratopteris richardii]